MAEIIATGPDISVRGTNTPLMKIMGNFTRFASIITLDGLSVGGDERRMPKEEKQREATTIDERRAIGLKTVMSRRTAEISSATDDIAMPKANPAITPPSTIAQVETGVVSSFSSVLILVSQGVIIGPTDEDVKNTAMASIGAANMVPERFLPNEKARNRNKGMSRPKIITGPFT